ncbi:MAG: hypothetical protein K8823_916 [Cenarchaeum symbiont of Oopsacas minuta]|nr:hypothetical protein [Cenarchaeum symbiont of Oopsacas minuta]
MVVFISDISYALHMTRFRYWKLEPNEITEFTYQEEHLLNWDIKCIREPEDAAIFIGVFLYKHGTPNDYKSVNGISFYYNNLDRKEVPNITKFLKDKFGGKPLEKGERVILEDSKEIYSPKQIAQLALDLESKFNTKSTITMEFSDMTEEEIKSSGMPEAKLLPIPGK